MKTRFLPRLTIPFLSVVLAGSMYGQNTGVIILPPPDDGKLTVVTITAPDPDASEPGPGDSGQLLDTALFTVHRSGPTDFELPVYYAVDGSASNGEDYVRLPGVVTIPAGASSADILIDPLSDNLVEGSESIAVKIAPPICIAIYPPPPECYLVGSPSVAFARLQDNDSIPGNVPPVVSITSPASGEVFKLGDVITIQAVTKDEDGYAPFIEFYADGVKIGEQEIVFIMAPPDGEPIYFTFDWIGAGPGYHVLTAVARDEEGARSASEPVRILVQFDDVKLPVVNVIATDPKAAEPDPVPPNMERPEILDTGTFAVTRTGETAGALVVYYRLSGTAINGLDYDWLSGKVEIPAGASEVRIEVIPSHDLLPERDETVVLNLVPPPILDPALVGAISFAPPIFGYIVGPDHTAEVVIADNDAGENLPPAVRIVSPTSGQVFQAPADIALFAHAVDLDGVVVSVEFFEGDRSLGVATQDPRVLSPINPFHIFWTGVGPGDYVLTALATDDGGATARSEPVRIKVSGDTPPEPPVVTIKARDPVGSENPGFGGTPTASFVVRRHGATERDLLVYYLVGGTAQNGVDYEFIRSHVTIPAGSESVPIVISPIDDREDEKPETVLISLTLPSLANQAGIFPPPYLIGRPGKAAVLILDNDHSRPPCVRLADGLFHLCRPGDNGDCYRVEVSTDLRHWERVEENTVTDGAIHFVDPDGPMFNRRFYRVIRLPACE